MANARTTNLTEGPPFKKLVAFMLPILAGLLFQQLYGIIDTVVVGKLLGSRALAGVGSTGAVNFLIMGFCVGICSGFAIPVAQKFGQRDLPGLRRVAGNIIWLGGLISVFVTIPVSLLCRNILMWMGNPPETFDYAYRYILILFIGIPATMLYNLAAGVLQALGNSRTPLYILIFSSIMNVVLDIILIAWIGMNVEGAAVASVISQLSAGILCLVCIIRGYPILHLEKEDLKLRRRESLHLLSSGLPMALQYSITAIGSTLLQISINHLGAGAMAAVTAGGTIFGFFGCPTDAIGSCAATFAGQNVGAGRLRRVHSGTGILFLSGVVYSAVVQILLFCFSENVLLLFISPKEPDLDAILSMGTQFLRYNSAFLVPLLGVNLLRFTIQGMGFSRYAVFAGVMELIARGVLAVFLVPRFGFTAVCLASPCAWILADLFLVPMYFIAHRMLRKRFAARESADMPA